MSEVKDLIHIVLLSEHFYPESVGTGRLMSELFSYLSEFQKNKISVISGNQSYRNKTKLKLHEVFGKIEIYRIKNLEFPKSRIISNIFFTVKSFLSLFLLNRSKKVDLVVVVTNPPSLPLAAYIYKFMSKTPYLYIVHDLHPDISVAMNEIHQKTTLERLSRFIQGIILLNSNEIVVIGRCMQSRIAGAYKVSLKKISVIPNWWSQDYNVKKKPKIYALQEKKPLRILYAGNIGPAQNFDVLLEAFHILQVKKVNVELLIVGLGSKKQSISEEILWRGITNISFGGFVAEEDLSKIFDNTDISIINLIPEATGLAVPSKLYNILRNAHPVIAVMDENSETSKVVLESGCGIVVKPDEPSDLIEKIVYLDSNRHLLSEMSLRSLDTSEMYTLEQSGDKLYKLIQKIL